MASRRAPKRQKTSGKSLDMSNYLNWSATKLCKTLAEANINAASNFPISVLRKLYLDNVLGTEAGARESAIPSNSTNNDLVLNYEGNYNQMIGNTTNNEMNSILRNDESANSTSTHRDTQSTTCQIHNTPPTSVSVSVANEESPMLKTLMQTVQSLQTMVCSLTTMVSSKEQIGTGFSLHNYYSNATVTQSEATSNVPSPRKFGTNPEELPHMDLVSSSIRKQITEDGEVQKPSSTCRQSSSSLPSHATSSMEDTKRIQELMTSSVAPSTQRIYNTGYQTYLRFTQMNNRCITSASELSLMQFVTFCHDSLKLSYQTIKLYLCGIRYNLLLSGAPNPFDYSEDHLQRLHMLLKGIKKQTQAHQPSRQPITSTILSVMCQRLQKGVFTKYTDILMETVCITAFFGFMRCAEFTCRSSFDPNSNLCVCDLVFHDDHVVITLKQSKTDPFRKGVGIKLFRTDASLCPYQQLKTYLSTRNSKFNSFADGPLFILENGNALTKSNFLSLLKELLKLTGHAESRITGHSFRIGAATSAAKARIEDHLIKSMGRWSSDSYLRYIRTPNSAIQHAQQSMLQSAL